MHVIGRDDVDRLLKLPALIDALQNAFMTGGNAPKRHHHAIGGGRGDPVHLLMPAWDRDAPGPGSYLGVKVVNVFPGNQSRNLPTIQGTYLLHSGETGAPLCAIDGARLTLWRTAAASALAARFLARPNARHLVMVGSGALSRFLVRAHAAVRPLDRVSLWNRTRPGAEALAADLADMQLAVAVTDDLERAVREADVVTCATLATAPLVCGAWLRPGTHLDLVGAFTLAMREADDEAIRVSRIVIDTEAALTEGGDVAIAIRDGVLRADSIVATLSELCRGFEGARRSDHDITLFKSVGAAIEDLAAAELIWRTACRPT